MKLIFIHGRAQEEFDEKELKAKWIKEWEIGLQKSGLSMPENVTIEFPYYAKTLIQLINEEKEKAKLLLKTRTSTPKDELDMEESLVEMAQSIELAEKERNELELILESRKHRAIQNWDIIHSLAKFLDGKTSLGNTLLSFLEDVFIYLSNSSIKLEINKLVSDVFDEEECVVVGHSLGSVVSYLVLKKNSHFKVKKLITIGSPLGIKALRGYLDGPKEMPKCVKNGWFNAFDKRDIVALYPLDEKHFNIRPSIENKNDVDNFTENRHSIEGYLQDKIIAKNIYDALI